MFTDSITELNYWVEEFGIRIISISQLQATKLWALIPKYRECFVKAQH